MSSGDPKKFAVECDVPSFTKVAYETPKEDMWKHRSSQMKCHTCMWFVAKKPEPVDVQSSYSNRDNVGRCRCHAPTITGYPVVFKHDWCGDHKIDENKI